MDLAMVLSGDKRDDSTPPDSKRPRPDPTAEPQDTVIAAASSAVCRDTQPLPTTQTPYADLQKAVHNALESRTNALSTSDKVVLALEVLRARQLELDLAQARTNIEALVTNSGSAPRTLRAVIPSSTVRGLPVGTPVDITKGRFLLSPTTNDPQALFLTLELQNFGSKIRTEQTPPSQPTPSEPTQMETKQDNESSQDKAPLPQ